MRRFRVHTRIALALVALGLALSACAVSDQVAAYPYSDPVLYGSADLYDQGWYAGDVWSHHDGWHHGGHWGHGIGHGGHFGGGHGGGHR
jgi:hypothetical protein